MYAALRRLPLSRQQSIFKEKMLYAGGLTKVIIGALALGLGELLGSGSATLFGSDQTSGMDELGL